ncbi:MAG: DUF1996 domain-containing protein [Ilumatobacteraceae bacterium]
MGFRRLGVALLLAFTAIPVVAASTADATQSPIPSEFDPDVWIAAGGTWSDNSAEVQGAHYSGCAPSHLSYDDPIVNRGQDDGAAGLNLFIGNTTTDESSTYSSLRVGGGGTCQGGPIDRSAYWIRAMLNGSGNVEIPDSVLKIVTTNFFPIDQVQPIPAGLEFTTVYHDWFCVDATGTSVGNAPASKSIPACAAPNRLLLDTAFPSCWDGVHDTSTDGSHLLLLDHESYPGAGHRACPSTHPVMLPKLSFYVVWDLGVAGTSGWRLDTDTGTPGGSFHAGWIPAFDPTIWSGIESFCFQGVRKCDDGIIGVRDAQNVRLAYVPGRLSGASTPAKPTRHTTTTTTTTTTATTSPSTTTATTSPSTTTTTTTPTTTKPATSSTTASTSSSTTASTTASTTTSTTVAGTSTTVSVSPPTLPAGTATYGALQPCRLLDTRSDPTGVLAAGTVVEVR